MWTSTVSTLLVFVGAPLVIWWIRRTKVGGLGGGLRVASRTALTRNGVVAVIETDGRRFLVGATDHGINLLTELDRDLDDEDVVVPMEPMSFMDEEQPMVPLTPSHAGPGKSPIETLRAMTVRKPTRSTFPHVRPPS